MTQSTTMSCKRRRLLSLRDFCTGSELMRREDVRHRPEPIFRTYQRLAAAIVASAFLSIDVAELLAGALCASYAVFDRRVEALEAAERSMREVCDELSSMVRSHQQAVVRAQLYRNDPYDVFCGFLPPLLLSDAVDFRHEQCCEVLSRVDLSVVCPDPHSFRFQWRSESPRCLHRSVAWVGSIDEYDCWKCAECVCRTEDM